jgi:CspA family cold shock protein
MEAKSDVIEYGIVKCYFPLKGYGFITRRKGRDLFFHRLEVVDESLIIEGSSVRFVVDETPKGHQAKKICRNA